jgi:hypothetical protein
MAHHYSSTEMSVHNFRKVILSGHKFESKSSRIHFINRSQTTNFLLVDYGGLGRRSYPQAELHSWRDYGRLCWLLDSIVLNNREIIDVTLM